ncbi:unnamed protein product [Cylindrotheca closterium]|uniref:JmjC domain-containing protein n=1 Tax=Cylindrotheca closterium TaxID=2856 RepID=A0AAD2CC46_9STRA|nr:unnamed protein product [Cylindrotheca closterium]
MSASPVRWAAPRRIVNRLTKRFTRDLLQMVENNNTSPHDVLSRFPTSARLTVKQSTNRFFMYEEHAPNKIQDDDPMTPTITTTPMELADLLANKDDADDDDDADYHYYWTSPISSVAPTLLQDEFHWYQQLHHHDENGDDTTLDPSIHQRLDPRGPSLWMGTFGSGTQCHYDVANNVILQLHGTKRIRCFPPHVGVTHLHVFPDAHPRARKSQVKFETDDHDHDHDQSHNKEVAKNQQQHYPHFDQKNPPQPFLDITLHPGDALEIPAFWFHHVENGITSTTTTTTIRRPHRNEEQEPSVSLNSFVLSEPMMIAQQIFQKASQPMMRYNVSCTTEQVPGVLRGLGVALVQSLGLLPPCNDENDDEAAAVAYIQRNLLDARYAPLMVSWTTNEESNGASGTNTNIRVPITDEQQLAIETCIKSIRSDFEDLVMKEEDRIDDNNNDNEVLVDRNGIVVLVALHLLELWAVQMVGASSVYDAWKKALL